MAMLALESAQTAHRARLGRARCLSIVGLCPRRHLQRIGRRVPPDNQP